MSRATRRFPRLSSPCAERRRALIGLFALLTEKRHVGFQSEDKR